MPPKTEQLQIRLTRAQKARLRRLARRAGQDVSSYVLSRALPDTGARVDAALRALRDESTRSYGLAELADVLDSPPLAFDATALQEAVAHLDLEGHSPLVQNYVAAMVERACAARDVPPPNWAREVESLDAPWFASELTTLREYLLRTSPVVFKRRNLFVESGARRV